MTTSLHASWTFVGTFRSYQQRILAQADTLISDHRLHVVAAPGSGKTILGLEVAGRLGKETLILSPSLAIRDQWVARLTENFAPAASGLPATSTSLRTPAFVTSSTYQSLWAAFTRNVDEETGESFTQADPALVDRLANVGTVILDEAHHLRSQWHRALTAFLDELRAHQPELDIVALTATPPYDSTPTQWDRYVELCGPVDAEISVPELVATGDLAPHQDYVLVNRPTAKEREKLAQLRANTMRAVSLLGAPQEASPPTAHQLLSSPLWTHPEDHMDECLDDESGCVGFIQLARMWGYRPPEVLTALLDEDALPGQFEDGFQFILDHPDLFAPGFADATRDALIQVRLLDRGKVMNSSTLKANRLLLNSVGKLDSIAQIAAHEAAAMGPELRMLVLADHIRAEALPALGTAEPLVKLGVVPAFEAIRRHLNTGPAAREQRLAILTGSCQVIDARSVADIEAIGRELGTEMAVTALPNCPSHVRVSFWGGSKAATAVLTRAFAAGIVTIVVGTAALLGEGWDCPELNTLVLASTVKATMMTNQMRGRAIRVNPRNPNKVASIWHLATVDDDKLLNPAAQSVSFVESHDFYSLSRRFDTFVGPQATEPLIESGIMRCATRTSLWHKSSPHALNSDNLRRSMDRSLVRRLWDEAIARSAVNTAGGVDLSVEVVAQVAKPQVFSAPDLLLAMAQLGILSVLATALNAAQHMAGSQWVAIAPVFGICALALLVVNGLRWHMRRRILDPRRRMLAQAHAVVATLRAMDAITSADAKPRLEYSADDGLQRLYLAGGQMREQQLFADAVRELYAPTRTPRYLLLPDKGHFLGKVFLAQNVPSTIGVNRSQVDIFIAELRQRGLHMRAAYTRSPQGRDLLVTARRFAASNIASSVTRLQRVLVATEVHRR